MLIDDTRMIARRFFVGEGIEISPDRIHQLGDLARAACRGALEQHVLDDVGDAALAGLLVRRSDADPQTETYAAHVRDALRDDPDAVAQRRFAIGIVQFRHARFRRFRSAAQAASMYARSGARPRITAIENTVRSVGTARSPATVAPAGTGCGTTAHTSTSPTLGAAASAAAAMSRASASNPSGVTGACSPRPDNMMPATVAGGTFKTRTFSIGSEYEFCRSRTPMSSAMGASFPSARSRAIETSAAWLGAAGPANAPAPRTVRNSATPAPCSTRYLGKAKRSVIARGPILPGSVVNAAPIPARASVASTRESQRPAGYAKSLTGAFVHDCRAAIESSISAARAVAESRVKSE